MRRIFLFNFFLISISLFSQNKAELSGIIFDESEGVPLSFANVYLKNTKIGVTTDIDGNYSLTLDAGNYTLLIDYLGYETAEVPFEIKSGENKKINYVLKQKGIQMKEVIIESVATKGKESAVLAEQKKAVEIKQSIGSEELYRKGIGDVATALTKTTGISKQEGSGNIYVRGLGDRYNISTINGLPLPSDNPSRKNIKLDIFNTDVIESIGIDKTFNFRNYGDFAGANIDIVSKKFVKKSLLEMGFDLGVNAQIATTDKFYLQDGPDKWGFKNVQYPNNPFLGYNFTTKWNPKNEIPLNNAYFLRGGKSFSIGNQGKLGVFLSASFDGDFSFQEGIARGSVNTQSIPRKDLTFKSYNYSTNTTAFGTINYKINNNHQLLFNSVFINSSAQDHDEYRGIIDIFDTASDGGGYVRRSNFDKTSLFINQLIGNHELNERIELNWGASYNILENSVPDRMQNTFVPKYNQSDLNVLIVSQNNDSENHRLFQNLNEVEMATRMGVDYKFQKNNDDYRGKISIGYNGRFKSVNFESVQFNFDINTAVEQPIVTTDNIDGYFNQTNFNNQLFSIKTFNGGIKPQTYDGTQYIHAGYLGVEYKLTSKFTAILSARAENIYQNINWFSNLTQGKKAYEKLDILPSTTLKYELNDKTNLKFAASKTYTLPQFKERAQFQFEDVTEVFVGNPNLYASTDYNTDIKWEYFPKSNELVSLTFFGKYIQNPINEIAIASATNDISFVNTGELAKVFGAEFEIRKYILQKKETKTENLIAGFNISYMYNNQDFNGEKVEKENEITVFFASKEGKLTGASDLLLNADVSYFKSFSEKKNIQATLTYNYFSDRIYAIGTGAIEKGDLIDKAVGTVDFILKTKLSRGFNIGFTAKNILNPTIERIQDIQNVVVSSYKKGSTYKVSLSYSF